MWLIEQVVKIGIQDSRKRAAWRCIGSESSKEQTQCHGMRVLSPNGPDVLVGADLRVRPEEGNHTGLPLQRKCRATVRRHPQATFQNRISRSEERRVGKEGKARHYRST